MVDHIRIRDKYEWIPPEKRKSRFGGLVAPRKPELRKPLLWLERDGSSLFLVNLSGETLKYVRTSTGGFQTCDDDVVTVGSNKKSRYEYKDVVPGEAVKVEEFALCGIQISSYKLV